MSVTAADIEKLLSQLKSEDELERENSAYLLGELGCEAIQLSNNTLKNREQLSRINPLCQPELRERVVAELRDCLSDKDCWVRGNAVDALGKISATEVVDDVIVRLDDNEEIVRASAAEALGVLGDNRATRPLISHLTDETWSVRVCVVRSLGLLCDQSAIGALKKLSKDRSEDVRAAVVVAINQLAITSRETLESKSLAST